MDAAWITYLSGAAVGFGVLETLGIAARKRGKSGTLTAFTRRELGIDPPHWRRWILGPAFGLALAWLGVHMLSPWL